MLTFRIVNSPSTFLKSYNHVDVLKSLRNWFKKTYINSISNLFFLKIIISINVRPAVNTRKWSNTIVTEPLTMKNFQNYIPAVLSILYYYYVM